MAKVSSQNYFEGNIDEIMDQNKPYMYILLRPCEWMFCKVVELYLILDRLDVEYMVVLFQPMKNVCSQMYSRMPPSVQVHCRVTSAMSLSCFNG